MTVIDVGQERLIRVEETIWREQEIRAALGSSIHDASLDYQSLPLVVNTIGVGNGDTQVNFLYQHSAVRETLDSSFESFCRSSRVALDGGKVESPETLQVLV